MTATLLLVDDDHTLRTVLSETLADQGWSVRTGHDIDALADIDDDIDLLITDVLMPGGNALDHLEGLKTLRPDLPVVVMSAHSTLTTALRASSAGAFEYLAKPFDLDQLITLVQRALDSRPHADDSSVPVPQPSGDGQGAGSLIGQSPAMQDLYRSLARIVETELTVLISGESGTGKEVVARTIHTNSKRKSGPFIALNMAAIPRELIESELFGHEKGSFTGATYRRAGRFSEAAGGTLFLDEIGDMPLDAQTRLLRVLQEGHFRALGGRDLQKSNVRIIAATNRDLRRDVKDGRFREDLFYRLNVIPLSLPPLRERGSDIAALADHFLNRLAEEGLPEKSLSKEGAQELMAHQWPGNVRELENVIQRLMILRPEFNLGRAAVADILSQDQGGTLAAGDTAMAETLGSNLTEAVALHLSAYFAMHGDQLPPKGLYARFLNDIERPLMTKVLEATQGNQIKAAELLGLNRNTLRKKLTELGIEVSGFKA